MKQPVMFKNKFGKKSNKNYEDIHFTCTIRFLDDSEPVTVTFQKDTKGQWLLDYVCRELNLVEKDYFGLRYVDSEKQRHWLDPWKSVYRQLKHVTPMVLCFRVKFYPTDPMKLKEEITRYFLFLQLRRDLHHGRLLCSPADANQLAAYIIQSEVGDYDPVDHPGNYVSEFKMLPKQTQRQEEKIHEVHKTLMGQVPSEAEGNFLKKACTLDTYGVDPHPVKTLSDYIYVPFSKPRLAAATWPGLRDQKGNQMYLGVTHLGIVTFQGNKRTHLFKWPQVNKIAFEGKMFIVHVTVSEKKHACGFKCPTFSACKHLWKCAVEQQYFFTLANGTEAPKVTSGGGIFTRGSKFRFSGKCQKEVYADSAGIMRDQPSFVRSASNPQFVRSFNKIRSTSMPNKLKDKTSDVSEVVVERNHIGGLGLPNGRDSNSESIEHSIPEESAVTISSHPYEPLQSPLREELPPIPGQGVDNNSEGDVLDREIEKLQTELERAKQEVRGSRNRILDEAPSYEELHPVYVGGKLNSAPSRSRDQLDGPIRDSPRDKKNTSARRAPTSKPNKDKRTVSALAWRILRFFLVTFLMLAAMMCIIVIIAMETEAPIPLIKDIRQWPEVDNFKNQLYSPAKENTVNRVKNWFS